MKKSELRKLVQEYHALKAKSLKRQDLKISERLKEIEHGTIMKPERHWKSANQMMITKTFKSSIRFTSNT